MATARGHSCSEFVAKPIRLAGGFKDLVEDYDGFILDQYGVMHNGAAALPGAVECFNQLAEAGKKIVVLSNTSQRATKAMSKLPSLGFDISKIAGLVCSGEEAWRYVAERYPEGGRCAFLTWEREMTEKDKFIDGLQLTLSDVDDADFILCHGAEIMFSGSSEAVPTRFMQTGEHAPYERLLRVGASRGLPMVCCNPDIKTVLAGGSVGHMPGAIATTYEEMGGTVLWFGKPHAVHFEACLAMLPAEIPRTRVVHVGDSLEHDVAGACNSQLASVFVAGGIHHEELGLALAPTRSGVLDGDVDSAKLSELCKCWSVSPSVCVRTFVW